MQLLVRLEYHIVPQGLWKKQLYSEYISRHSSMGDFDMIQNAIFYYKLFSHNTYSFGHLGLIREIVIFKVIINHLPKRILPLQMH